MHEISQWSDLFFIICLRCAQECKIPTVSCVFCQLAAKWHYLNYLPSPGFDTINIYLSAFNYYYVCINTRTRVIGFNYVYVCVCLQVIGLV